MSVFTGTYTTHTAIGRREDLQNAIFDISPMDTPFISGCSRGRASAITHEWQTDTLADATNDNAQVEGDDYTSLSTSTPTVKVEAPDKPIEINMNINIKHEILIKVERQVEELLEDDMF